MDITRDDLKHYQNMRLDLQSYDYQIEALYDTYRSPRMSADGASRESDPGDPTARAYRKIDRLKEKRRILINRMEMIEEFVESIEDNQERAICRYHYILGFTWEATCLQIRGHHSLSTVSAYDARWWSEFELRKSKQE